MAQSQVLKQVEMRKVRGGHEAVPKSLKVKYSVQISTEKFFFFSAFFLTKF